jgi:chloramphenicol-sensitive protein RarD
MVREHEQRVRHRSRRRSRRRTRQGFIYGLAAYALWGVLPIYFKALANIPPVDIVAHRVLWSVPFLLLLTVTGKGITKVAAAMKRRKITGILMLTALLIGFNWLLYVYAVTTGRILAASFGYYLNPLANILLGYFVLSERLTRLQWTAVGVAAAGIAVLAAGALGQLWISLALCISFALYGLLRKVVRTDATTGLMIETLILLPFACAWFVSRHASNQPIFGGSDTENGLLLLAGVVSTTPLLLFTRAARKLEYSTLGMLQFVAPTLQFLIAVLIYGERFTWAHAVAFAAIWTALALYVTAMLRAASPKLPQAPE